MSETSEGCGRVVRRELLLDLQKVIICICAVSLGRIRMSYCALSATRCVTEFSSLGSRKKMGIVHPFPVNVFINSLSECV